MVFVGKHIEVRAVTRLIYTFMLEGQGDEITALELALDEGRNSEDPVDW